MNYTKLSISLFLLVAAQGSITAMNHGIDPNTLPAPVFPKVDAGWRAKVAQTAKDHPYVASGIVAGTAVAAVAGTGAVLYKKNEIVRGQVDSTWKSMKEGALTQWEKAKNAEISKGTVAKGVIGTAALAGAGYGAYELNKKYSVRDVDGISHYAGIKALATKFAEDTKGSFDKLSTTKKALIGTGVALPVAAGLGYAGYKAYNALTAKPAIQEKATIEMLISSLTDEQLNLGFNDLIEQAYENPGVLAINEAFYNTTTQHQKTLIASLIQEVKEKSEVA